MTRAILGVFVLFVVLAVPRGAESKEARFSAPPSAVQTIDIPKIDGVAVDGDASDWGDRGYRVDIVADCDSRAKVPADFDPTFRLGWTDKGVLLLVAVADDTAKEWDEAIPGAHKYVDRRKDSLNLLIASDLGSQSRYQMFISPGVDANHPQARIDFYDLRPSAQRETPIECELGRQRAGNGYVMEFLLPWPDVGIVPSGAKRGKVAFQIDFVDADEEGEPRFRAFWFPSTETYRDATQMHVLKLADAPSSPEKAVARASLVPGGVPWVRVAGIADIVGEPVVVRKDSTTLAESKLEIRNGRAGASLLLPPPGQAGASAKTDAPPGNDDYENIQVLVSGSLVSTLSFDDLPTTGTLDIESAPARGDKTKVSIKTGWPPPYDDAQPGVATQIRILDLAGSCVAQADGVLGGRVELSAPEGLYRVEARCKDFGGWALEGAAPCIQGDSARVIRGVVDRARKFAAQPGREAYAGWIEYLAGRIERCQGPDGRGLPDNPQDLALELGQWVERIEKNPGVLGEMRGRFEWAYLSKADGSGQPFKIVVPDDYRTDRTYPLALWMHGRTGSHNDTNKIVIAEPRLELSVMGRGRASGYRHLAEVDVLEAMDFVCANWNVDGDRVYLAGKSMGGGGTFLLGSRHPDRFASASPFCGFGVDLPVENMLNLPVHALHSRDDDAVAISLARAPLRRLQEVGGQAFLDEADGFGHEVDTYTTGVARCTEWVAAQKRVRKPTRVLYQATDEFARGAYWVEVDEWGPESRPATIDARTTESNALGLTLDNVAVARLDLAASPIDLRREMNVSVNAKYRETLQAPAPDTLWVIREGETWRLSPEAPPRSDFRLHFPGGAAALFHGEPIMIVWGTKGDDAATRALRDIAQIARRSSSPAWPTDRDVREGVPIDYTLYGLLPAKADVDVADEDIAKYNLVLLGDAGQNALVAKMADRLPVRIATGADGKRVKTDDGLSWGLANRAFGLLHYNPLAPKRFVYWVASDHLDFYRPDATLMRWQQWTLASPDFLMTSQEGEQLVAARHFDSRWRWEKGYAQSPTADPGLAPIRRWGETWGDAMRAATQADFALVGARWASADTHFAAGETRQMDLGAREYNQHVAVMDIAGDELLAAHNALERYREQIEERQRRGGEEGRRALREDTFRFVPQPSADSIKPTRLYRVAMAPWIIGDYSRRVGSNPPSFRLTDRTMRDTVERHLAATPTAKQD